MITTDDISAAHSRIAGHVRRTPTLSLDADTFGLGLPLSMKLEFLQVTGTFKARGAFNTLLAGPMPKAGVCAASGGNHGIAVAYAAAKLGIPAKIYVPEISSPAKIARIRETGAELVVGGARYSDALAACEAHAAETGALSVHAYDAWPTIAGQGTVGLEWEQDAGGLDTVLVAVGGGGLISGISRWFEKRVKVVGVEPEGSRALQAALEAGHPVDVEVNSIAADSLGARNVFARVHETAALYVDQVVLAPDDAIREAQKRLWLGLRAAAEPGGAAALAALISGAYRPAPGERVGVLACGANVDLASLAAVI
ncbi:threonine/serine dehydratase [Phreatobacter aquaticus]|uniref:Threonine/serine dehydratase n=1 Tax=Phreatobacter aquaticus TaxID=2570229 RepID=A0A4D7QAV4_9HYPH|nr:threonine/serine dehydratase [Phreatobacter aquaticus]QCK85200.1 threonine/serine dehydratase [Phreatobacter aquaticus]